MEQTIVKKYMTRAIELACLAYNQTLPNPRVGAVIFDDEGNILGEGYHKKDRDR